MAEHTSTLPDTTAANSQDIIPANFQGKSVDLEDTRELSTVEDATVHFKLVCDRLIDPTCWHGLTGTLSATFTPKHDEEDLRIKVGDYIQVDLPAPGPPAGEGHDWVKVEQAGELCDDAADQSFGLTVSVAENPSDPGKGIAHFFDEGATSTFIVKRKGTAVTVSYHGRNEKPNLSNEGLADKIRNTIVALGATAGISEIQWKAFLSSINKPAE